MKLQNNKTLISILVIIIGILILFIVIKKPSETKSTVVDSDVKGKINFEEIIGQKAPLFELESIDGTTIKLSDYLGKNVVLFFNEGSMCYPACWDQMAKLGEDSRFDTESVVAFSIVTDPKSQWLDIVSKSTNLTKSKIIFDTSRSVSMAYDVLNLRSSMHPGSLPGHTYFIIDKEGIIRFTLDDPNMALANDKLIKAIEALK
ncbi:MAG: redoxin domain-containing protein [Candidatus Woesebacteria bacterium]|nr:redoxin domain-containing protein [Candidatus Woesebacteria bacterium]